MILSLIEEDHGAFGGDNATEAYYYDNSSSSFAWVSSSSSYDDDKSTATMETTMPPTTAPTTFLDTYKDEWYENKWMLVTPRVTAFLSLFAIVCVAVEAFLDVQTDSTTTTSGIVKTKKRKSAGGRRFCISAHSGTTSSTCAAGSSTTVTRRNNVIIVSRIQFFYQIPLFAYTLAMALGSLPAPQGQAWGSLGDIPACSFQGWLLQFGIHGLIGWDAVLSATYLLMVRYSKNHVSNAKRRLLRLEKYYHIIIWSFALLASVIPLTQDMYNFNNTVCWIESYPDNCIGDQCVRGDGDSAVKWQNLTSYLSMIHLLYSIIIMVSLYCSIRGLEAVPSSSGRRSPSSTNDDDNNNNNNSASASAARQRKRQRQRQHSRAVGIQGMLYCSGMILTIFPSAFYILLWNAAGLWSTGFSIFATAVVPLIGYVNFCVFMRGRTQEACHTSYAKFLRRIHSTFFRCFWSTFVKCRLCHTIGSFLFLPRSSSSSLSSSRNQHTERPMGRIAVAPSPTLPTSLPKHHRHQQEQQHHQEQQHRAHHQDDDIEQAKDGSVNAAGSTRRHADTSGGVAVRVNDQRQEDGTSGEVPSSMKRMGSWRGIVIWANKKRGSSKKSSFGQWVSELGASGISEDDDDEYDSQEEDDDDEEDDDSTGTSDELDLEDAALPAHPDPAPPAVEEVVDKRPPLRPIRILSESILSEVDGDGDGDGGRGRTDQQETVEVDKRHRQHWHPFQLFGRTVAPPTKPERYISEVEAGPPPTGTTTTKQDKQKAPTKPERCVSEVEAPAITTKVSSNSARKQQQPPTRPERLISEVEPPTTTRTTADLSNSATRKPPTKPERFVSEVEASFSNVSIELDHVGLGNI